MGPRISSRTNGNAGGAVPEPPKDYWRPFRCVPEAIVSKIGSSSELWPISTSEHRRRVREGELFSEQLAAKRLKRVARQEGLNTPHYLLLNPRRHRPDPLADTFLH